MSKCMHRRNRIEAIFSQNAPAFCDVIHLGGLRSVRWSAVLVAHTRHAVAKTVAVPAFLTFPRESGDDTGQRGPWPKRVRSRASLTRSELRPPAGSARQRISTMAAEEPLFHWDSTDVPPLVKPDEQGEDSGFLLISSTTWHPSPASAMGPRSNRNGRECSGIY